MYSLKAIARFMDNHNIAVAVVVAASLVVIAVYDIVIVNDDNRHWLLVLAQSVGVVLSAMWIIDAPRFRDSLDFKKDLFDCKEFFDLHSRYLSNLRFFKAVPVVYQNEADDADSESQEHLEAAKHRPRKLLFPKFALLILWVLVGLMMLYYIIAISQNWIDVILLAAPIFVAYAMNLVSFYLCFIYAWEIVEVAKLARGGLLPYNWSRPSKTPGYVYLKRVSRQLNVCFLIVSLLFALFILLITTYAFGFDFSKGDPIGAGELTGILYVSDLARPFRGCFIFTLLLGIVAFLALHFISRINLDVILDSWEQQTLDRVMPIASSVAEMSKNMDENNANKLKDTLIIHGNLNTALSHVSERQKFDSVDAASLILAFLTLVVAIATLLQAVFHST